MFLACCGVILPPSGQKKKKSINFGCEMSLSQHKTVYYMHFSLVCVMQIVGYSYLLNLNICMSVW